MINRPVVTPLLFAILTTTLAPLSLQAQQPVSYDINDDFLLDEIIVTAQKRFQNIQDVPVSVSAYSEQALQNSNISNFSDLNRLSAGLSVVDIGNGLGSTVRIRGVGQEAFGLTLQPSVAIIIDGIAQPRLDTAFASFLDIESVEVLRGPQGTLWGRNAPAGAITIKTVDPDISELEGSIDVTVGNYGTERYVGTINVPIIDDVLGLRITGFSDQRDGSIRFTNFNNETDSSDRSGGRIKLRYEPNDKLAIQLSHEKANIESRPTRVRNSYGSNINERAGLAGVTLAPADPFDNRSNVDHLSEFNSTTKNSSVKINWQFADNYSLSFLSGYQEFSDQLYGEVETSSADLFNVPKSRNIDNNFSHELQLTYQDETLSYIVGGYYSEVHQRGPTELSAGADGLAINTAAILGFAGGPAGFSAAALELEADPFIPTPTANAALGLFKYIFVPDISLENQYDTYVRALYGHITIQLAEQFALDTGVRYSSEKVATNNTGTTSFGVPIFPVSIPGPEINFSDSETFESVSGNIKLTYDINDNIALYAGVDYGYKAGGFNGAALPDISSDPLTREFDEETTTNYEMGWKTELLNRRLRANGAIFLQSYDDYQVQLPEATSGTNFISNADVITRGVETDITYLASTSLTLSATAAYIDAYYDDYKNAPCTQPQIEALRITPGFGNLLTCQQDLSDTRLNLNSRWSANINALYQGSSIKVLNSHANWFGFAEAAFRDDFVGDPSGNQETKTESYILLNAKIGLRSDNWEAELWVKNLTDKAYFVNLEEASFSDGTVGIQGERRTAGARVKFFFK